MLLCFYIVLMSLICFFLALINYSCRKQLSWCPNRVLPKRLNKFTIKLWLNRLKVAALITIRSSINGLEMRIRHGRHNIPTSKFTVPWDHSIINWKQAVFSKDTDSFQDQSQSLHQELSGSETVVLGKDLHVHPGKSGQFSQGAPFPPPHFHPSPTGSLMGWRGMG